VFNAEKYLGKCLESLQNQNISTSDFEIILVNDDSDDASLDIAVSFTAQFPNFVILSQSKTGVGAARNLGIQNARGKFLFFVDADDYIQPNSLSEVLNCIEDNNLDILRFNYVAINEAGKVIPKKKNSSHSIVFSEEIVNGNVFLSEYLGWACYNWSFLFNASLIRDNKIYFNPTIYFEDVEWLLRIMSVANRVRSIDRQVYTYLHRSGSITQSNELSKKNKIISDKLYIIEVLKKHSLYSNNEKVILWCNGMISLTFMGILAYVTNEVPGRKDHIIRLLKNHYLPLKSYHFTIKQRRDILIINLSVRLYCFLKRKR